MNQLNIEKFLKKFFINFTETFNLRYKYIIIRNLSFFSFSKVLLFLKKHFFNYIESLSITHQSMLIYNLILLLSKFSLIFEKINLFFFSKVLKYKKKYFYRKVFIFIYLTLYINYIYVFIFQDDSPFSFLFSIFLTKNHIYMIFIKSIYEKLS